MKIELKKDSWHFKFYTFMVDGNAPKSLCPYFWTLVVSMLLSPAILIFKLLSLIGKTFKRKRKRVDTSKMTIPELEEYFFAETKRFKRQNKLSAIIILSLLVPLILGIVVLMVYAVIKDGVIALLPILIMSSLTFLIFLLGRVNEKYKVMYKLSNVSLFVMIRGMIKAIYTKTCPLINWK
jgi:hypothetical protein